VGLNHNLILVREGSNAAETSSHESGYFRKRNTISKPEGAPSHRVMPLLEHRGGVARSAELIGRIWSRPLPRL